MNGEFNLNLSTSGYSEKRWLKALRQHDGSQGRDYRILKEVLDDIRSKKRV